MAFPGQPSGPVQFRDLGLGKLRADMAQLAASKVTFGFQGDSGSAIHPSTDGTATVAEVAAWNEYGTVHTPARPALGTTTETKKEQIVAAGRKALADLIDRRLPDAPAVLRQLGEAAVEATREVIEDSRAWAEPLAASTVKAKGHDQPWRDTGTLSDSVSWSVRRDGTVVDHGGEK